VTQGVVSSIPVGEKCLITKNRKITDVFGKNTIFLEKKSDFLWKKLWFLGKITTF
jgi:hypothetical protein